MVLKTNLFLHFYVQHTKWQHNDCRSHWANCLHFPKALQIRKQKQAIAIRLINTHKHRQCCTCGPSGGMSNPPIQHWQGPNNCTVQSTEPHSGNANRTSMNHWRIREALGGPCAPLLLGAAEGPSLLTAAEIWKEQPSWVKTGSLAGPLAGLQKTPGGRTCGVCVCV